MLNCPLCTEPSVKGECIECGIFWCRYCERWRGWKNCCSDNMPDACDECWMPVTEQFHKDDLVWWQDPDKGKCTGIYKVVSVHPRCVYLVRGHDGVEVGATPEELIPVQNAIQIEKLLTIDDLRRGLESISGVGARTATRRVDGS